MVIIKLCSENGWILDQSLRRMVRIWTGTDPDLIKILFKKIWTEPDKFVSHGNLRLFLKDGCLLCDLPSLNLSKHYQNLRWRTWLNWGLVPCAALRSSSGRCLRANGDGGASETFSSYWKQNTFIFDSRLVRMETTVHDRFLLFLSPEKWGMSTSRSLKSSRWHLQA